MKSLVLIGIGTGNPDHLTLQAVKALNSADLIILPRKGEGKADLADLRREICASVLTRDVPVAEFDMPVRDPAIQDYRARVDAWHSEIAGRWVETAARHPELTRVALLVWGDPSLYDSTLRIAERLSPRPKIEVIPGITSIQALTASHAVPLNDIGEPFIVTTGRKLADQGWPVGANTVVVMLDGNCAFQELNPDGISIWWGAYLGTEDEIAFSGPLASTSGRIVRERQKARETHGWIMDIYILRKLASPTSNT